MKFKIKKAKVEAGGEILMLGLKPGLRLGWAGLAAMEGMREIITTIINGIWNPKFASFFSIGLVGK